ncbi:hypothetical protein ECZU20_53490 [Escherichia coli]|nr:hypothetical protein ECZU20_53490 [Escherichia coli]
MSLTKLLPVILLMMATGVQASTRDEIERLWNPQGMAVQPAQPAADTSARTEKPAPRWFRLSNGRQVNGRLEGGAVYAGALPLLSPV